MGGYTPGPWGLETVPTSVGSCHKIGPFPSAGVRPQVHACVYADGIRIGLDETSPIATELAANARLIAAAPDLLEALRGLLAEKDDYMRRNNLGDPMAETVSKQARAAISRATGEGR